MEGRKEGRKERLVVLVIYIWSSVEARREDKGHKLQSQLSYNGIQESELD